MGATEKGTKIGTGTGGTQEKPGTEKITGTWVKGRDGRGRQAKRETGEQEEKRALNACNNSATQPNTTSTLHTTCTMSPLLTFTFHMDVPAHIAFRLIRLIHFIRIGGAHSSLSVAELLHAFSVLVHVI